MINELIAYMELHLISLEQDSEKLEEEMSKWDFAMDSDEYKTLEISDIGNNGEIRATAHLLSVARDILAKNERK